MNKEMPNHWGLTSCPPVGIKWYGLEMKDRIQDGDQVYNFTDARWADVKEHGLVGATTDHRYVIRENSKTVLAKPEVKRKLSNEEFLNQMEALIG